MAFRNIALLLVVAARLSAQPVAITHVTVIDATGRPALQDQTVVYDRGVITSITPANASRLPRNTVTVDGTSKFLIPGLWDMHIHLRGGTELVPDNEASLSVFAAMGITGVREMGGDIVDTVFRWRKEIAVGKRIAPRIVTSGPKLDGPKPVWPGSIPVKDAPSARAAVKQLKRMGSDFVKLYFANIDKVTFQAILSEARKQHLPVSGHLPFLSMSVRDFVDSGVHSIEHSRHYILPGTSRGESAAFAEMRQWVLEGRKPPTPNTNLKIIDALDDQLAGELMTRLKQHDVYVVPTLVVTRRTTRLGKEDFSNDPRRKYVLPGIWNTWQAGGRRKPPPDSTFQTLETIEQKNFELVARLQKAGVGLLAGSDSGASNNFTFPAFSLHEELRMLVESGLTPMEALQTATRNAARYLKEDSKWGTIEKGKRADLVLLNANPLQDIANTEKIDSVILNGRLLRRQQLDRMLAAVAAKASQLPSN